MKHKAAFVSLPALTKSLIYRLGGERYHRFIHIFMAWKSVVGELLASHSHPFKYERNILFVAVHNSTWMQELLFLKPQIISQYKSIYQEEIADLILVISSPKRKCTKRK